MSVEIPAKFDDIIANSEYIWLTTVNHEGMPQPTPVWFIREGNSFVVYSEPSAQKVKNVRANPNVALGFARGDEPSAYLVVMGTAVIDQRMLPPDQIPAYQEKYRGGIADIGYTPETHAQTWSMAIRITPTRVRGEVE